PVCVGIRLSPSGGSHPLTLPYRVGIRVPVTLRALPAAASNTLRVPFFESALILTNLVRVFLPEPAPTLESDLAVLGVPLPCMSVLLLPLPTAVGLSLCGFSVQFTGPFDIAFAPRAVRRSPLFGMRLAVTS